MDSRHILLSLVLSGAIPLMASAQDLSQVEIAATRVAPGLHVLFGRGGNIAVSTGADGPLVIDDQFAPLHPKILAEIQAIQSGQGKPGRPRPDSVRFVVNTHWHGDHTGGNEAFGRDGALIVAHDEVRARMSAPQSDPYRGRETPAAAPGALPVLTFSDSTTLHWNGERIRIQHVPNAHTDGDSLVWFENAGAVHMGDTFFNGSYPFIDVASGGSIDGAIRAIETALERVDAETVVIPGHGAIGGRSDLERSHQMLVEVRKRVQAAIDAGEEREAWIATRPLSDLEPIWGGGFMKGEQVLALVWISLGGPGG